MAQLFLTPADSPYDLDLTDSGQLQDPKTLIYTSGNLTINLPALRNVPGQTHDVFVLKQSATHVVTVNCAAGNVINIYDDPASYAQIKFDNTDHMGLVTALDESIWVCKGGVAP